MCGRPLTQDTCHSCHSTLSVLLLRNVDALVTACQVSPVLVDSANKVSSKLSRSSGADAFQHHGCDCLTDLNQA